MLSLLPARRLCLVAALVSLAACGGDDDEGGGSETCNLSAGPGTIFGTVTYAATATGNGTMSQIRLQTEEGVVVVNNPTLPYNRVEVLATRPALIEATGTVSSGSLTIQFSTQPTGGTQVETGSDECSR